MIDQILQFFGTIDYTAIFILMTIESSVFPFPSEVVMIPAGISALGGHINPFIATLVGGLGSLVGALLNYYILGRWLGRPFLKKYGKYVFVPEDKYKKSEALFQKNALLYTFVGRLIPAVRQLISIPAGIFRMKILSFSATTFVGATLWCGVLVALGYFFGDAMIDAVHTYGHNLLLVVIPLLAFYIWFKIFKK